MKTIKYIYVDCPAWNCERLLTPDEFRQEMELNRKYHANITESESGATVRLTRR